MDDIVRRKLVQAFSASTIDEQTTGVDAGVYIQPQVWAKNKKNRRPLNDPSFPMYGGPGAKYVKVKKKCSTFPYCNQGDINALDFYEPVKKRKSKKKKNKLTPLGRRKRKIAKDLVRTQKIKTPRGKHYNIGKRISESNRYLYNNELTENEVKRAILENTMKNKINYRTIGKNLEETIREKLVKEAEQAQGYKIYQQAHAESGKSNSAGLELANKKIKEFLKDDSGETFIPKMHRNSKGQNEFVEDVYYSSGQTGLEFDGELTDEQKKRHLDYLEGSIETGNNTGKGSDGQQVANITTTNAEGGNNKTGSMLAKSAERRAKKKAIGDKLANNDRRYTPDTVVTTTDKLVKENKLPIVRVHEHIIDTEEQILKLIPSAYKVNGREFSITNGDDIKKVRYENYVGKKGGHIVILDSINPGHLQEQMDRMKDLMAHDMNKDKRFR